MAAASIVAILYAQTFRSYFLLDLPIGPFNDVGDRCGPSQSSIHSGSASEGALSLPLSYVQAGASIQPPAARDFLPALGEPPSRSSTSGAWSGDLTNSIPATAPQRAHSARRVPYGAGGAYNDTGPMTADGGSICQTSPTDPRWTSFLGGAGMLESGGSILFPRVHRITLQLPSFNPSAADHADAGKHEAHGNFGEVGSSQKDVSQSEDGARAHVPKSYVDVWGGRRWLEQCQHASAQVVAEDRAASARRPSPPNGRRIGRRGC